jgi:outer membrane protein assembly factor BamA
MSLFKKALGFMLAIGITSGLYAQSVDSVRQQTDTAMLQKTCEPKDLVDYIRQWFNMKGPKKEKNSSIFIAPVFGSTPSTGFVYGVTVQGAFQMPESRISAFQANVQYTTKNQFTVAIKNNVFTSKNRLFLSGDWCYFDYSLPTYGLGTNAPLGTLPDYFYYNNVGEPTDTLVQPMNYKYYKLHQTISWKVKGDFFIGTGFHFDHYSQIEDLKLDTPTGYITSHYAYSKKYGFNPGKYTAVGISLNLLYDSRDNMINARKGIFANINYRINPEFLGSDQKSSSLWTEFRTYLGLSKKRPDKVLAFWYTGNFTLSGTLPYLNLPAIGNDQRQKTGRGYTISRFRGQNLVYGEAELRLPISKCTNTLGAVFFLNATTASNKDGGQQLFEYIKPGYGAGIRVLFNKKSRMNIAIDYGKGEQSGGIYFGASEVF